MRVPKSVYQKHTNQMGFSLIELSIVLVIAGILITLGITVANSLNKRSKMSKVKGELEIIKNNLISYGINHGRLPCPDTDGDGNEDCPVSGCGASPCNLPYISLSSSSTSVDIWSLPYKYDVSDVLTTTSSQNLCSILYEASNVYNWLGNPANAACGASDMVCVTTTADADNGAINTSGQGYYLAAYALSQGEDRVLGGKNRADGRREYEMRANQYDVTVGRDDLVIELSYGELASRACDNRNTIISVTVTSGEVWLDNSSGCAAGTGLTGTVNVSLGQTLYYKNGCGESDTFEQLARCDLNPGLLYAGTNNCINGTAFNGAVRIDPTTTPTTITQ